MKFNVSYDESNFFISYSTNSLVMAFKEVYGVREFIIRCKKFSIRGSHFIYFDRYDDGFHYMISCFLSVKQVNKLYKLLCKN